MTETGLNGTKKRDLLRRVRRQRLRYIAILPSLITILNGLFGFAAICFASDGVSKFLFHDLELSYFAVSGYLIFVAMIADMLDGRVARMSHLTSSFGGQLDSLCDIISFGVAPAFLLLRVLDHKLTLLVDPTPDFAGFLTRFIWLAAAVYLACAAIRLARFNVENEEDETAHMNFLGLPTPAAAGVVASIVVFYEDIVVPAAENNAFIRISGDAIIWMLPFVAIGCGILMISRIQFPHIVNQYMKGRKPMTYLAWALIVLALLWWFVEAALLVSGCSFVILGIWKSISDRIKMKRCGGNEHEPPVLNVTGPEDEDEE